MYQNFGPNSGSSIRSSSSTQHLNETAALGILQHLNKEELQQLLDDDTKLTEIIADLQQVKSLQLDKETCLASNKSLADYNLCREPKFEQAKKQLAETYEQAIKVQKEYDQNKQKLQYLGDQQSLDTVLALLQTEAAKAEEDSENVAENFLDGNMEIDDFLETYVNKRKHAHLRKVKADKMQEMLRNRQNQGPRVPKRLPPPPPTTNLGKTWSAPPAGGQWGGSVPYPTGNFGGMPDPSAYMPR